MARKYIEPSISESEYGRQLDLMQIQADAANARMTGAAGKDSIDVGGKTLVADSGAQLAKDLSAYMAGKRAMQAGRGLGAAVNVVPPMRNVPLPGQSAEEPAMATQASTGMTGQPPPQTAYEQMRDYYARFTDPEAARAFGLSEKKKQLQMMTGSRGVGTVAPQTMAAARGELGGIIGAEQAAAAKSAGEAAASKAEQATRAGYRAYGLPEETAALPGDVVEKIAPKKIEEMGAMDRAKVQADADKYKVDIETAAKVWAAETEAKAKMDALDAEGKTPLIQDAQGNTVVNPAYQKIVDDEVAKLKLQGDIKSAEGEAMARRKMAVAIVVQKMKSLFGAGMTEEQATAVGSIVDAAMGAAPSPATVPPPEVQGGAATEGEASADLNKDGTVDAKEAEYNALSRLQESAGFARLSPLKQDQVKQRFKLLQDTLVKGKPPQAK